MGATHPPPLDTRPSGTTRAPATPPSRGTRSPLLQLTLVRAREFYREPEAVFWTFIFPILLASGLGIAFRSRPAEVARVAVVASTPAADSLRSALARDAALQVELLDDTAAATALRIGRIALAVVPGAPGTVEYRYDDAREDARAARLLTDRALQQAAGRRDPVAVRESLVRERGSRYIDFVLPGLLAMNLMGGGIWGLGFAIVDARRKKLLKRLIATPMSRAHYLLSFLLMRLAMMVVEVGVVVAFGILVFGVPLRGSLLLFAGICTLGTLMFGAVGLLIASRARTLEGASGLMNFVMLPMWVGSGIFFAATNFPDAVQPVVQALPLTALVDAMRANMLEGGNLSAIAGELGIMTAWLVACFALALRLFRWR
jgi:ABC-type multidrug transport system permease subunit